MNDKKPQGTLHRIVELDALRGIAAAAVLACHLPRGFWFGSTGVDLFFVLSGFLITTIILRGCDQPGFLTTFYWRRSLRIFPIYYLTLFVAYSLNSLRQHPEDVTGFPYYLVYLQNIHEYWGGTPPPAKISIHHTWTLAIEEQFYLFWPVVFFFFRRRIAFSLALLMVVSPLVLRQIGLSHWVLFGHTDGLAMGALLAWIIPRITSIKNELRSACFAGIALVGFLAYAAVYWQRCNSIPNFTGDLYISSNAAISLISVAYFGLIGWFVCMSGHPWLSMFRNRYLVSLGTISYGLYLYHQMIYGVLDTVVNYRLQMDDPWWLDVCKVSLSLVVAVISWRWIEQPIIRLKDRYRYEPLATKPVLELSPRERFGSENRI